MSEVTDINSQNTMGVSSPDPTVEIKNQEVSIVFQRKAIQFRLIDGRLYVNATQMARLKNIVPHIWVKKQSVMRFRSQLVSSGKSPDIESQVITKRGSYGSTWIVGPLAIQMARDIGDDFFYWLISFLRTMFPQNYGVHRNRYEPNSVPPKKPDNIPDCHKVIDELYGTIQENLIKCEYWKDMIEDRKTFKTTFIAEELHTTASRIHQFLETEGILVKEGTNWITTAEYRHLQEEVPYMRINKTGKAYAFGKRHEWTHSGRQKIIELWRDKNLRE